MTPALAAVRATVGRYYGDRLRRHGATPLGVDWRCLPTQQLRFARLLQVVGSWEGVSLNDLGCGYGALLDFLAERHDLARIDYCGTDLSAAMIRRARRRWPGRGFAVGAVPGRVADYGLASGIFHVRLDHPVPLWEAWIRETLGGLHATSRLGFAVNFILAPTDGGTGREGLYRTRPEPWIAHCEQVLGARATLAEGDGLGEFTLLVRRQPAAD
ncbi:methyltransferase [Roseicella frigidaeris]|uniref:SAM-dependent methyltransferase n=1 Tax=Roseicella frigidaeris TaxID=2230885 RepID=A0A327M7D4_9PROT|nr:methyltransferase domain-containing protein [Roseicella frigidaeris]RAI58387.1 SAM-dependent methyltransferase [Roseicella frigidaeris]